MRNLKNKTNEQTKSRIENKLMVARVEGVGRWAKWVKEGGRYRPPVMERISHRDKRYSVRNIVSGIVIALYGDRW